MRSKNQELMCQMKEFAEQFYQKHLRSPYTSEIAEFFHIAKSTVHRYLVAMDENGMIHYQSGTIMTDKIRKTNTNTVNVGLVGAIPCGSPESVEEHIEEYISLPVSLFGKGEFYLLRASGDSMINAGIQSGGLVLIRKTSEAKEGDIVVALIDNEESTLKTLRHDKQNGIAILHPENDEMEDIKVSNLQIQGVAVNVIKSLIR